MGSKFFNVPSSGKKKKVILFLFILVVVVGCAVLIATNAIKKPNYSLAYENTYNFVQQENIKILKSNNEIILSDYVSNNYQQKNRIQVIDCAVDIQTEFIASLSNKLIFLDTAKNYSKKLNAIRKDIKLANEKINILNDYYTNTFHYYISLDPESRIENTSGDYCKQYYSKFQELYKVCVDLTQKMYDLCEEGVPKAIYTNSTTEEDKELLQSIKDSLNILNKNYNDITDSDLSNVYSDLMS